MTPTEELAAATADIVRQYTQPLRDRIAELEETVGMLNSPKRVKPHIKALTVEQMEERRDRATAKAKEYINVA